MSLFSQKIQKQLGLYLAIPMNCSVNTFCKVQVKMRILMIVMRQMG